MSTSDCFGYYDPAAKECRICRVREDCKLVRDNDLQDAQPEELIYFLLSSGRPKTLQDLVKVLGLDRQEIQEILPESAKRATYYQLVEVKSH